MTEDEARQLLFSAQAELVEHLRTQGDADAVRLHRDFMVALVLYMTAVKELMQTALLQTADKTQIH